jgi:hypothetical protein
MLVKRVMASFCLSKMKAEKYIRSISQQALLFKPTELRQLTAEEAVNNRIVKEFFEKYPHQVIIK